MKKLMFALTCTAIIGLTACNQHKTQNNSETPATPENKGVKVNVNDLSVKKDVVCGMDIKDAESIGDTTFYDGKMYGFCSSECKDSFMVDPQRYLANK